MTDEEVLGAFPDAMINWDNVEYYRRLLRHELVVGRCEKCGTLQFPLMPVCPACMEREVGVAQVSGNGEVYMRLRTRRQDLSSFTVPTDGVLAIDGWATIASVSLDEQPGLRFTSFVLSDGKRFPEVADRVSLVWLESHNAPFPAFQIQ